MTDTAVTAPKNNELVVAIAGGVVRSAMVATSGALISFGWLDPASANAFVSICSGIALGAIGVGWSALHKWLTHSKLVQAYWAEPQK